MTEYHGLFLPEDGVSADDYEPEPIMQIEVTRRDPSGPKRIPRAFAPGEIPNHQALYDLFGGGVYELLARRSNGQTYAKRLITLAGAPKPILALDLEQPCGGFLRHEDVVRLQVQAPATIECSVVSHHQSSVLSRSVNFSRPRRSGDTSSTSHARMSPWVTLSSTASVMLQA